MKCSHSHIGGWGIALIVLHLLCHEVPMIAAMLCAVFN